MNKKMQNTFKTIMIAVIIVTLIISLIVSQDKHHLETCNEDHCFYCALIHIAQIIVNLTFAFVIAIVIGVLIYLFLSRLRKGQEVLVQSSLVFQRVQFNE